MMISSLQANIERVDACEPSSAREIHTGYSNSNERTGYGSVPAAWIDTWRIANR
jgi:hypothetical protein